MKAFHYPNFSVAGELNKLPRNEFQRLPQFDLINGDGERISRFRARDKTQATQLADEWVRNNAHNRKLNGWEPIRNWKVEPYVGPAKKEAEKWMSDLQAEVAEKDAIRKTLPNGDEVMVVRTTRRQAGMT